MNDPRRFWLLVAINAFVGAMVGLERTTLPLLAEQEFGIASAAAAASFVASFGLTKAIVNLFAGHAADAWGRRRVLLLGWALGIPVPLLILSAPSWPVVVAANALLGVNQGLAWSMTLNLKLDLVPATRRGFAAGWNEVAGYTGVAVAAYASALLAARVGLRESFLLGVGLAAVGLALSLFAPAGQAPTAARGDLTERFRAASGGDARLTAASGAGLATNLKDGALWALLPLLLAARGLPLREIGLVVAAYPLAWGALQAYFGPLSDRVDRRALASGGLALQAAGLALFALASALPALLAAALLAGIGTAMAYPTLLAHVADLAPERARATALGVYRFWRDLGYAAGAVGAGLVADAFGLGAAVGAAAVVVAGAAGALLWPSR